MSISSLSLWHLLLVSHIADTMSDAKICDTGTSCIMRLESDTSLTGWGEVCPIPHYLPAYTNGVAPAPTELAPICRDMSGCASTHPSRTATEATSSRQRPTVLASIPTLICLVRRFLSCPPDRPFAMQRIEARENDDHRAGHHRHIGYLAKHQQTKNQRPDHGGVAEWRDEADIADADGHYAEQIAADDGQ